MGSHRKLRPGIIGLVAIAAAISASAPPTPAAGETATTVTWSVHERTLADGRTYFVRAPTCAPAGSTGCAEFLGRPRALVVFLHAANGNEDRDTASWWLSVLSGWSPDTLVAFGVSKDGTKLWDGGVCCTQSSVDDVGYLARLVGNVARGWSLDRTRVGLTGLSNGGILALRAVCERPDLVRAAVSLAGTYGGPCDAGRVKVAQWHGADDPVVPLNGGTVRILGEPRTFPPAASLSQRMSPGSFYLLHAIPGRGHGMGISDYKASTRWLITQLR